MTKNTLPTFEWSRQGAERLMSENVKGPTPYLRLFRIAAKEAKPGKRLELLRAMAQIKVPRGWTKPENRRKGMRKNFTFSYYNFPDDDPCFVCGGQWHHRHHVLQLQNGGANSRGNLVPLCRTCHRAVHRRTF